MVIDKELFDECFCPVNGIARICLRGDKNIPKELEELGKSLDTGDYMESCFSINVIVDEKGNAIDGIINYMAENAFYDCFPCENYNEAWEYYKSKVDKETLKETIE